MPKKPSPNRIKKHRVYTVWEAADALDVHRKTVARWITDGGLQADQSKRPWLIEGHQLKTFLIGRRLSGKTTLRTGECYCLPCRQAQIPAGRMADFQMKTATSGTLSGICPACDRMIFRAVRRSDLESIRAVLDVTVQKAAARIVGARTPLVTVPFKETRRTYG